MFKKATTSRTRTIHQTCEQELIRAQRRRRDVIDGGAGISESEEVKVPSEQHQHVDDGLFILIERDPQAMRGKIGRAHPLDDMFTYVLREQTVEEGDQDGMAEELQSWPLLQALRAPRKTNAKC
jgi:hypothetical protein